mmetsp:Transcript_20684/g.44378  ORF Transcript_20684/g.44378 Transcript_20684/m.44378 type:complete len:81 (-) Transcript_20684:611-853(-)
MRGVTAEKQSDCIASSNETSFSQAKKEGCPGKLSQTRYETNLTACAEVLFRTGSSARKDIIPDAIAQKQPAKSYNNNSKV